MTFEDNQQPASERRFPRSPTPTRILRLLQENDVTVNAEPLETGAPWWQTLLFGFGPTILFVFLLFWLFRRAGNVQSALGAFGRSRCRYEPTGDKVTFADVAGIERRTNCVKIVDFLRNPEVPARWSHSARRASPARPEPGERCSPAPWPARQAPFYSLAASEFVEAIVGVGAARVRDLFKQAKENPPAIVFIDELDAVSRARTSGVAGFNSAATTNESRPSTRS